MNGKVALVTGGSRGIGRNIAMKLADEGFQVAITYNSNEKLAMEVVRELEKSGSKAACYKANISIKEEVDSLFKEIEKELGTVDVLVNNAGITKDNLLIKMSEDDRDPVMDEIWENNKHLLGCRCHGEPWTG